MTAFFCVLYSRIFFYCCLHTGRLVEVGFQVFRVFFCYIFVFFSFYIFFSLN